MERVQRECFKRIKKSSCLDEKRREKRVQQKKEREGRLDGVIDQAEAFILKKEKRAT